MNSEALGKRSFDETLETQEEGCSINCEPPNLPLGTFAAGASIYRNKLSAAEGFRDGHLAFENVVLPETTVAFCTAMSVSERWLQESLGGISNVLVVQNDPMYGRTLGHAQLLQRRDGWYRIGIKPCSGLMHAKLSLFRCQNGLRVVIAGSNLNPHQWQVDRDCLWCQDYFLVSQNDPCDQSSRMRSDLEEFSRNLTKCETASDQLLVTSRLNNIFDAINFSTAQARLVVSFPGRQQQKIGWQQLALSVNDLLRNKSLPKHHKASPLFAMAGSFGDLRPNFLFQMKRAMRGQGDIFRDTNLVWDHVQHLGIHCLWPSLENAMSMTYSSFAHCRSIPQSHWESIPESTRRYLFFDAPPNPSKKAFVDTYPVSHAKVLYQTHGNMGVVYVGSHNFSVAAWGLGACQPHNVEIGVVLFTETLADEWKGRLPCKLPTEVMSSSDMIPATLHLATLQAEKYQQRQCHDNTEGTKNHTFVSPCKSKRTYPVSRLSDSEDFEPRRSLRRRKGRKRKRALKLRSMVCNIFKTAFPEN